MEGGCHLGSPPWFASGRWLSPWFAHLCAAGTRNGFSTKAQGREAHPGEQFPPPRDRTRNGFSNKLEILFEVCGTLSKFHHENTKVRKRETREKSIPVFTLKFRFVLSYFRVFVIKILLAECPSSLSPSPFQATLRTHFPRHRFARRHG